MRTRFGVFLFLVANGVAVYAAEDKPERIAKAKADEIAQATLKGDFGKVLDLTYPKILELGGGRKKVLTELNKQMNDWKTKGIAFQSVKVGDAKPAVAEGTHLFTVLPMTVEMKVPGGTATMASYLLGISPDKGKTWTFIDGSKAEDEDAKKILPKFPAALKLPTKEKPVFKPDK